LPQKSKIILGSGQLTIPAAAFVAAVSFWIVSTIHNLAS